MCVSVGRCPLSLLFRVGVCASPSLSLYVSIAPLRYVCVRACVYMACQPVNPQNDGKLVHVACDITQLGTFKEEDLGVCVCLFVRG